MKESRKIVRGSYSFVSFIMKKRARRKSGIRQCSRKEVEKEPKFESG